MILNLLGNAVKFTAKGSVDISVICTECENDRIRLAIDVRDSGIGMKRDVLDRIFDPFFQVQSGTSRLYGGTGLGLPISQRLVGAMSGTLTVNSEIGVGSVFTVQLDLPYSTDAIAPIAVESGVASQTLDGTLQGNVLSVEDNDVNQMIVRAMLTNLGLTVTTARDGAHAIELYSTNDFDLLLMDCEMPGMDGYEASRRIRALEAQTSRSRTPIVAITAHALTGDREECLKAGMDDYLSKPVSERRMADVLTRWLSAEGTPSAYATLPQSLEREGTWH